MKMLLISALLIFGSCSHQQYAKNESRIPANIDESPLTCHVDYVYKVLGSYRANGQRGPIAMGESKSFNHGSYVVNISLRDTPSYTISKKLRNGQLELISSHSGLEGAFSNRTFLKDGKFFDTKCTNEATRYYRNDGNPIHCTVIHYTQGPEKVEKNRIEKVIQDGKIEYINFDLLSIDIENSLMGSVSLDIYEEIAPNTQYHSNITKHFDYSGGDFVNVTYLKDNSHIETTCKTQE